MPSTPGTFREMGKEPCPVCEHKNRCKSDVARDVVLCFRRTDDELNGFRRIKHTAGCTTYVRVGSSADRSNGGAHDDWQGKADSHRAALTPNRRAALAGQLHVTPEALKRIGAGWSERISAYTFPESDGRGRIIGITTRHRTNGTKRGLRGSKRGLVVPTGLDKAQPVLVVEGASDVAAALTAGLQAVGRPTARGGVEHLSVLLREWIGDVFVLGERDQKPDASWPGLDGATAVAGGIASRLGRAISWALPPENAKDLRQWVEHEVSDVNDADARATAGRRIMAMVSEGAEPISPEDSPGAPKDRESPERAPSQSTVLVELVEESGGELFHSDDVAYAAVAVQEHVETWPVRSRGFKRWLARCYHKQYGRAPSAQPMQDAMGVIEGKALFDGSERAVFVRVGHCDGALYLDLADPDWRVAEVKAGGWRVIEAADAPARFRRSRGMQALPEPVPGGSLADLRQFVNLGDDDSFILGAAWLVGALQPNGPYPVLVVGGEQGSGKSFTCRVLRRLLDPNAAELRSEPRDERDIAIGGNNAWVLALDNLSHIRAWLSDALCRLSTGGGFATRELFSDADEMIFAAQRPLILNGIEEVAVRPDLLDRSIILTLPTIPETGRRDESALWAAFEAARPRLLGALLTAVSAAMRELRNVRLDRHPRMADFGRWVVAAELGGGVPWEPGAFMDAYSGNRAAAVDSAIEASAIGTTLVSWLNGRESWTGTASDLLSELDSVATDRVRGGPRWPKSGRGMSGALRRLAPAFRAQGVGITWPERTSHVRAIHIERERESPSQPSHRHENRADGLENADLPNGTVTVGDERMTVGDGRGDGDRHTENPLFDHENPDDDGCNGRDGRVQEYSESVGACAPEGSPGQLEREVIDL